MASSAPSRANTGSAWKTVKVFRGEDKLCLPPPDPLRDAQGSCCGRRCCTAPPCICCTTPATRARSFSAVPAPGSWGMGMSSRPFCRGTSGTPWCGMPTPATSAGPSSRSTSGTCTRMHRAAGRPVATGCECQYKTRPIDPVKPGHLAPMFIVLDCGVGMCAPAWSPLAACARMCPPRETACLSVGRILVGGAASPPRRRGPAAAGRAGAVLWRKRAPRAWRGEDGVAVDEPVEQRGGELLLAEDLGPAGEVQVGGDRHPGPPGRSAKNWKSSSAAVWEKGR